MSQQTLRLLEEALQLPESERGDFAAKLIESLDPADEVDIEDTWSAEIKRRVAEIEAGQAQTIPWSEARQMILDDTDDAGSP